MEPIDDSSEEEIVFKGYSFDSGRAVRPSDIVSAQNELFHLSMSKNHSRTRQSSSASAFSDNEMSIDTEISEKLALSIDVGNSRKNKFSLLLVGQPLQQLAGAHSTKSAKRNGYSFHNMALPIDVTGENQLPSG